ncbi:MAG: acyltransferase [Deltaproteobacteria bacterium]|nr:acyltransferase [Deltaproteobacteria bacterium]
MLLSEMALLRSFGENVRIYPLAKIIRPEVVSLGDNIMIDDFVFIDGGTSTEIGSYVHIGCRTFIVGGGELVMEGFTGLSGGVSVYTGGEDYSGRWLTNPTVPQPWRKPYRSHVIMRRHSLIGAGCTVLAGPDGIEIGEGASVGAMSLVKSDLEPWTVYAGIPARPIKKRDKNRMLELEEDLRRTLG